MQRATDRRIGAGTIAEIPSIVRDLGARRVLLVCGRRSFDTSGAARILPELEAVATVTTFRDFRPNTDAEDLATALEVLATTEPDLVLGIGGGSALDLAKLLAAYADVAPAEVVDTISAGGTVATRRLGLVLAPTTSGSGAETTRFAVVYVGVTKHSIAGPAMLADAVVVDPELTLSGSPAQRATSGIDAVAQAIESLWAAGADDASRRFAAEALDHLLDALVPFVTTPRPDAEVALAMATGAHLAGRAIDRSRTTAAHALSYGLTKGYGLPHGHAVGVTLGAFVAAHAQAEATDLQPAVDPVRHTATMADILARLAAADPPAAQARIDRLLTDIGLTPGLVANGVRSDAERRALVAGVNVERLGNNPVVFDATGLLTILERCG